MKRSKEMKRRVEVEQGRVGIEGERLGDCDLIIYSNEYYTSPLWYGGCLLEGLVLRVKTITPEKLAFI